MNKFGFIVHPLTVSNIKNYWFQTKVFPDFLIRYFLMHLPPFKIADIKIVASYAGNQQNIDGYLILCPLLLSDILHLEGNFAINKIVGACNIAEKLNVDIIGLAGAAGIIGNCGEDISSRLSLAVTNGTTLAGYSLLKTVFESLKLRNKAIEKSKVTILGATNPIGMVCAHGLAKYVSEINLIADNKERLYSLQAELSKISNVGIYEIKDPSLRKVIERSDIIALTPTSLELEQICDPGIFKKEALICKFPNISNQFFLNINKVRQDLLILEGGIIETPFNIPPILIKMGLAFDKTLVYPCVAETILLLLEKKTDKSFSVGGRVDASKIEYIANLANKYSFKLYFRQFGAN